MRLTGVEYERALPGRTTSRLFAAALWSSDKIEIENSRPEVSISKEAVKMEVTCPLVRNFPNQACARARIFRGCEQTPPRARPSAKGEFQ